MPERGGDLDTVGAARRTEWVRRLGQPASVLPGASAPADDAAPMVHTAVNASNEPACGWVCSSALSLALPVSGGWLDRAGGEQRGHGGLGFRGGGQDGGQPGDGG